MQISVTAKVQIKPNNSQKEALVQTMDTYRQACSYVSRYIYHTKNLAFRSLHDRLYRKLRRLFGLKAQMAQSVIKTVIARYKALKTSGKPWVLIRFRLPQYDLVWHRDWSLKDGEVSLNTLGGRARMPIVPDGLNQYFDGTWKYGTAKLVQKHGKWFLHIPVTKEFAECDPYANFNVCGVDLGINFLAVAAASDGKTIFYDGRPAKDKRAHFKRLRTELQKKNTPGARRRLRAIGQRESRWMQNENHRIAKALVCSQPAGTVFVLEDLTGIRNATERVRKEDRYMMVSWAFDDLRRKIEYKALLAGSTVLIVDPRYTSQKCPVCGHTERKNRKRKEHAFECCRCGYRSNDDRVGAMNLCRMGTEMLLTQQ